MGEQASKLENCLLTWASEQILLQFRYWTNYTAPYSFKTCRICTLGELEIYTNCGQWGPLRPQLRIKLKFMVAVMSMGSKLIKANYKNNRKSTMNQNIETCISISEIWYILRTYVFCIFNVFFFFSWRTLYAKRLIWKGKVKTIYILGCFKDTVL